MEAYFSIGFSLYIRDTYFRYDIGNSNTTDTAVRDFCSKTELCNHTKLYEDTSII